MGTTNTIHSMNFIPIHSVLHTNAHIEICTQENCEYESNFGNAPTIPLKI